MRYPERQKELDGEEIAARDGILFATERLLREAGRNDGEHAGVSEQQIQQLVGELLARKNGSSTTELGVDPVEIAQEMAFQAMESDQTAAALALADRALALDPHCVDALAVRAALSAESDRELIEHLQKAVAVGDARLGEEFFAEYMGDFWKLVEARPYLRTVRRLAEACWDAGHRFDAVDHFEYLLELDLNDHQDTAQTLLVCYLGMGEVGRTLELLADYGRDDAISQSCAALAHYLAGDYTAADAALTRARRLNPHVLPYLTGDLEIPEGLRTRFEPGSEDEAIACGQILGDAWSSQSGAYLWLLACADEIGAEDTAGAPDAADPAVTSDRRA